MNSITTRTESEIYVLTQKISLREYCQEDLQSIGEIKISWQKVALENLTTKDDCEKLPQCSGLYFFIGKKNEDWKIDIGQTYAQTLSNRVWQHITNKDYLEYCGKKKWVYVGQISGGMLKNFTKEDWHKLLEQIEGLLIQRFSGNEQIAHHLWNDAKTKTYHKSYKIDKLIMSGLDFDYFYTKS